MALTGPTFVTKRSVQLTKFGTMPKKSSSSKMKITDVKGGINIDFNEEEMAAIVEGSRNDGKKEFDEAMQGVDFDNPLDVMKGLERLFGTGNK